MAKKKTVTGKQRKNWRDDPDVRILLYVAAAFLLLTPLLYWLWSYTT